MSLVRVQTRGRFFSSRLKRRYRPLRRISEHPCVIGGKNVRRNGTVSYPCRIARDNINAALRERYRCQLLAR